MKPIAGRRGPSMTRMMCDVSCDYRSPKKHHEYNYNSVCSPSVQKSQLHSPTCFSPHANTSRITVATAYTPLVRRGWEQRMRAPPPLQPMRQRRQRAAVGGGDGDGGGGGVPAAETSQWPRVDATSQPCGGPSQQNIL